MAGYAPRLSSDLRRLLVNDMFDCWESQGYAMKAEGDDRTSSGTTTIGHALCILDTSLGHL
jgi:hypothetical protein